MICPFTRQDCVGKGLCEWSVTLFLPNPDLGKDPVPAVRCAIAWIPYLMTEVTSTLSSINRNLPIQAQPKKIDPEVKN